MDSHLITYEDAVQISEAYKNFNFYRTDHMVGEFKISTFNYFLCDYGDFVAPIPSRLELHGFDMRGVTFVFNEDGTLYKRFLMLRKFFNVNQVEETQYNILKDKKIKRVTVKEDGSLVAFMRLPDGTIFAKTQGGFTNEQSKAAMNIYTSQAYLTIQKFVIQALDEDCTPLFEYVAFDNRIVLQYSGRQLKLIGTRNNRTGEFISASELAEKNRLPKMYGRYDVDCIKSIDINSLDKLMELAESEKDIEGWVVEFEDGQMVKIKTRWYFDLHGLRTMNIFREDFVIRSYLEEKLDDILSQLDPLEDKDAFEFVENVKASVDAYMIYLEESVDALVKAYNDEYKNWAKFATAKFKSGFFGLSRVKIEKPESYMKRKIEFVIKMTNKLTDARFFVEKWSKR